MTFVIVNKDLDLSVGSTYGLIAVVFARLFAPSFLDLGVVTVGDPLRARSALAIGLVNGVLVTILKVPAFIATLTMLFIGRGFVLGADAWPGDLLSRQGEGVSAASSSSARPTPSASTTRSSIFAVVAVVGAYVLAKTRWGYETFATGGNEQAAIYAGIPTNWVRIRAYLISSLCATLAGADVGRAGQGRDRRSTASAGELIVIASVIIGGASILGGRGRVIGSCLGGDPGRADRQGAARGLADHPHHQDRRRGRSR